MRRVPVLLALLLVIAAATPARASVSDPTHADVVVASAPPGGGARFPDIVKLANGRLLAVYRDGAAHTGMDGRILLVESRDSGRTWSTPRVAVDSPYDDRDPKIMQTRSGTVLLSFFETDWSGTPATIRGTFVVRSRNSGATWSAPTQIGTHMTGPSDQQSGGYWLGFAASHGEITQLHNGDLLAPLYGTLPDDPWQRATVVRSSDDGRTWNASSEATIAAQDGMHFQEPVITVLRSGEIVALIRTTVTYAYLSRSFDNGHTWTTPVRTDMAASSHHLLRLHNGDVLITYGDTSGQFSPRRVTVGRLIRHPERSWDGIRDVFLYDSGTDDQANPSSAEIAPGRFLTLSYDTAHGTIVGVFSRLSDYSG
jgi:BNR repeat protein